jgi:hypothetical protein
MGFTPFIRQFWTYSVWSVEALVIPPIFFMFAGGAVSLVFAYWKQSPFQSPAWKNYYWLVVTQIGFFPCIISTAVIYPASGRSYPHVPSRGDTLLNIFFGVSLALAAFWILRMKSFRWLAASAVVMVQAILMGAFFIAGMAVSGDWI